MTGKPQKPHWEVPGRLMSTKVYILAIFFLLVLTSMGSLHAQEGNQQAHDVEVRIFLIDIENVDTVGQSFTANLTIVTRWRDPGLSHKGPASISVPLGEIWYPKIQILNQQRIASTLPNLAEVRPDGEVIHRQRIWGSFSQPLDLEEFPFDSQNLKVSLANVGFGEKTVNLVASPGSGISEALTIADWKITGWKLDATDFSIEDEPDSIKGMVFSVDIERDKGYFKYKVIFPLILIVMMSWLVFWIDPTLAASQISVSVTAMLTMIAYRFALAGMIPRLAFLTSLDYFVLASTLMVFMAMIEVVYTAHLSSNNQVDKARRVDFHARWVAPLIYFSMAVETLYFRFWV